MSSFLLTANPDTWRANADDFYWLLDQADLHDSGEQVQPGRWSTHRRRGYSPGDRVYLLLQGKTYRGIVASGTVQTGEVREEESWRGDGTLSRYLAVTWDAHVYPEEVLATTELESLAPATGWRPMSGGTKIDSSDEAAVEEAWIRHLAHLGYPSPENLSGTSSPGKQSIPVSYGAAIAKVRRHQKRFRELLFEYYDPECAFCGLDNPRVLDAAHLHPDALGGEASVENGRLLCPNHHRALDAGLIKWTGIEFVAAAGEAVVPPMPQNSA
jgi:hypothetical protein